MKIKIRIYHIIIFVIVLLLGLFLIKPVQAQSARSLTNSETDKIVNTFAYPGAEIGSLDNYINKYCPLIIKLADNPQLPPCSADGLPSSGENPSILPDNMGVELWFYTTETNTAAIESWYKTKINDLGWSISKEDQTTIILGKDNPACKSHPKLYLDPGFSYSGALPSIEITYFAPCFFDDPKGTRYLANSPIVEHQIVIDLPWEVIDQLSSSSKTTVVQNQCVVSPDEEQKRQEIFNYINTKYNFKMVDSNVCGQLSDCGNGNNPPWPPDDLNNLKNFLDSLPSCFINRLNLKQIEGLQWSPSVENNWDPNSLGQREGKAACCSQEAKDNCNVAHYWGQGYNHIIVCGDMYKNGVDHTGTSCSQYFSLEGVLAHEMTHALQFNAAPGIVIQPQIYSTPLMTSWIFQTGWTTSWGEAGKIFCTPVLGCNLVPPNDLPTNYAKRSKDPTEDMAESVRLYYEHPVQLKQISQRRYDFVKNQIMCGKEFNNGQ